LIEGDPGAGKTTTGLQFLLAGNKQGEAVLYVTLSESKIELQRRPADVWRDYVGGPSAEHAGLVGSLTPWCGYWLRSTATQWTWRRM